MEKSIFIPDDVIEEILLRLPVEDLLLWKCVSKRWYILIWDDDFVKKHYCFHYSMRLASHGDAPLLLNFPTGQFHLLSKQGERDVVMTSFPDYGTESRVPERRVHCIGVVNGIVGLQWNRGCLALWNPATREFKDVPRLLVDDKDAQVGSPTIIGLGFDLQSKDFKILGGLYAVHKGIIKYYLYSLRAESWKRVKDTPRTYTKTKLNILSNPDGYLSYGVWYWIAYVLDYSRPAGIVAFNFCIEVFKEVELPSPIIQFQDGRRSRIGKYKEGLAIFRTPMLDSEDKCIKIWAATRFCDDDYEVPSSWELVVKISPINLVNGFSIKAIFDCGDLLLKIGNPEINDGEGGDGYVAEPGTYVYHPSTRTFKYLAPRFRSSYKYMESLFPLSRRLNYINSTS